MSRRNLLRINIKTNFYSHCHLNSVHAVSNVGLSADTAVLVNTKVGEEAVTVNVSCVCIKL